MTLEHHPLPEATAQPKGATGIAAGVLAVLGGLGFLAAAALHIIELVLSLYVLAVGAIAPRAITPRTDLSGAAPVFLTIAAVTDLVAMALLSSGGILLLQRKGPGRVLTAIGAGIALGFSGLALLVPWISSRSAVSYSGLTPITDNVWPFAVVLVAAAATLLLALMPPTMRWVAAGTPRLPRR
ncbi:hypothetical protein [Amycolatopsis regifaucium]|uniref:Uncharacterized protein n=1 Tax=Amycolatopsis regifaucium TaxID=546365 RepID=A0A154MPW9_9PSEU|nr:hypothetical protein [Amycolatopsis regifaucium]KZB85897.1 hypothetical protein AVL48_27155 [Amycolatopsis regifaucium]OKA03150.1 hypothetical protein ATP06_0237745 [Amycolatopsis regifaucium]SFH70944.1 hypothetical protein SAMN04489731_1062 [Amycolatopsis regifaucium]